MVRSDRNGLLKRQSMELNNRSLRYKINQSIFMNMSNHIVVSFILYHYCDAIMGTVASQITNLRIVYTTVYSDADQSKLLVLSNIVVYFRMGLVGKKIPEFS